MNLSGPETAAVIVPMIAQFLLVAVIWLGSAPLPHFRFEGAPSGLAWFTSDLTRLVLPVLMVATGLLFFSAPLAPLWAPVLGLEGTGFTGVPGPVAVWMALALDLGLIVIIILGTGGVRGNSPFVLLLVAFPVFVALLIPSVPGLWAGAATVGLALLLGVFRKRPGGERNEGAAGSDASDALVRFGIVLLLLACLLISWPARSGTLPAEPLLP